MARDWKARPTPQPTSITEAARRYHACAQALAATLGLSLAEVLAAHRESVTAIYIEVSKCEVRLPASVQLPPLHTKPLEPVPAAPEAPPPESTGESAHAFPRAEPEPKTTAPEPEARGVSVPTVIPSGLPCSGRLLVDLKPPQLSLLIGKLEGLAAAKRGAWITLLQALRDERQTRLAKGKRPVLVPVEGDGHGG